jgi:hypothetical protein
MGLRDVVAARRAERAKPKSLAELRARKQEEKQRPKTLAELRASKAKPEKPKTLATLKQAKQAQRSSKLDINVAGVKYHNVQQMNGYWTVDMTNGDRSFTLHNRHGAWFHDLAHGEGRMAEPVNVGRALGISDSQLDISMTLQTRLERELRARGIPTREELVRQHEEAALAARRKARKTSDD